MNANKNGENMEMKINESFFAKDIELRRKYNFGSVKKQTQMNMLIHDLDLLVIDYISKKYEVSRNSVLESLIQASLEDIALFDDEFVSENDARYLLISKVDELLGNSKHSNSWDADLFFVRGSRKDYLKTFMPKQKEMWDGEMAFYEKITSNQYDILERKLKQIKGKS